MDVTAKTLREVEFRERMRGYHPEDVDHFLEEVAAGLELLQERMRQALERASRAEAAASEAGGNDETLRKTLVLAQRTADMAVQEAREQAARITAGAEQQAQSLISEAEERSRRTMEEITAESRAELARLEAARAEAQREVDTLKRWVDEHKTHLMASLRDASEAVERAGILWPAPSTRPAAEPAPSVSEPVHVLAEPVSGSVPSVQSGPVQSGPVQSGPVQSGPDATPSGPEPAHAMSQPAQFASEPAHAMSQPAHVADNASGWAPMDNGASDVVNTGQPVAPGAQVATASPPIEAPTSEETPTIVTQPLHGDDRALDDFFEDNGDELDDDERRFGGRLRRRR